MRGSREARGLGFRVDREAVLDAIARLKKYPDPAEVTPPASALVEFATRLLHVREQAVLDGGFNHLLEPLDCALAAVTSTFFALTEPEELKRFHAAANAPISSLISAIRALQAGVGGEEVGPWFEAWLQEHFPKADSIFDLAVRRCDFDAMARWCFVRTNTAHTPPI